MRWRFVWRDGGRVRGGWNLVWIVRGLRVRILCLGGRLGGERLVFAFLSTHFSFPVLSECCISCSFAEVGGDDVDRKLEILTSALELWQTRLTHLSVSCEC